MTCLIKLMKYFLSESILIVCTVHLCTSLFYAGLGMPVCALLMAGEFYRVPE